MNTGSKNNGDRPPVLLLFGPTAVGKTELLIELFEGRAEVINADSMQVYRGLNIGTAKPDKQLLERLPHHLIDLRNPDEAYSVGEFVRAADALVPEIRSRARLPVIAGGTAFYLRTFVYGLPTTPRADTGIKEALTREYAGGGADALWEELERVDPRSSERIARGDRYRLIRALEVYRSTGRPLSSYALPSSPRAGYRFRILGLERERETLYRRIDARVERMIERGLPGEVEGLLHAGYDFRCPALRAIGYREFAGYFAGERSLAATTELIKRNSRRFAKRQLTFFKQLPEAEWYSPDDRAAIAEVIAQLRPERSGGRP